MIRIGICGYGNLGKGVEFAICQNADMELVGIFTRREPKSIQPQTPGVGVYSMAEMKRFSHDIDVMILCGGSATDLPTQTPEIAKLFNVVDSFDTHAKALQHYMAVDASAVEARKIAVISTGWDPGMFSLNRAIMEAILPAGKDYTFWGKGVSQGHSDAIRRIPGVVDARQYTIPVEDALNRVRNAENPELTTRQKHTRECYVVAESPELEERIEKEIKEMSNYFADYDTTVHFITLEELHKNHSGIPHGGFVIRTGKTGKNLENNHVIEYSLKLDSNPEFTGSVLVAYARAAYRLNQRKECGCRTVFDIAPRDLSALSYEELLKHTL